MTTVRAEATVTHRGARRSVRRAPVIGTITQVGSLPSTRRGEVTGAFHHYGDLVMG